MKYLITGLGNIGEEYRNTRHNIGFTVLDALAKASNLVFTDGRYGATCKCVAGPGCPLPALHKRFAQAAVKMAAAPDGACSGAQRAPGRK